MNWSELEEKGEVSNCEICGKKIWKFWMNMVKGEYPEMKKCAPCTFNKVSKQGGSA